VVHYEREREMRMAASFSRKRLPSPPFFSVAAEVQSFLSARERSWLALGLFGG
jgi:hypothetical protein